MASALNKLSLDTSEEEYDFRSLEHEVDSLLRYPGASNIKNQLGHVEFLIRKTILITIKLPEFYPVGDLFINVSSPVDTSNLKESRAKALETFLNSAGYKLQSLIQKDEFCIVKTYDNCLKLISKEGDDFLQALDILENYKHKSSSPSEMSIKSSKQPKITKVDTKQQQDKFKGADILFQRFKWDGQIDKSQITIGYLDRFKGIQEIKFFDFKGVHDDRDGIPLHRIRYYKINETIVWDREQRIDILSKTGDISHFFKKRQVLDEITKHSVDVINKTTNEAYAYMFEKNQWSLLDSNCENNEFFSGLKIVSYNIMSTNNFQKGKLI